MKKRTKPVLIMERDETIRKSIISFLEEEGPLSAKEISGLSCGRHDESISLDGAHITRLVKKCGCRAQPCRISEKEVYVHLEHIKKSLHKRKEGSFAITPARCRECGFEFKKRERLKKPSRCPVCKSELLDEPVFLISAKKGVIP